MISTIDKLDELWELATDQHESLDRDAFNDISKVFLDFFEAHSTGEPKSTHWVCDAAPGHGKTTVMACVLKMFATEYKEPALLVFNNKDTMTSFYDGMKAYADKIQDADLIVKIDADNINEEESRLRDYLYVCITQQRLRDLALGYGKLELYTHYKESVGIIDAPFRTYQTPSKQRMIIIDEMPILFDECIFDIASKNNSVDWFDTLAKKSPLSPDERQLGRSLIVALIALQMIQNETTTTTRLSAGGLERKIFEKFNSILERIKTSETSPEDVRRFNWFKTLYTEDATCVIDRHDTGSAILCSKPIDYTELGNVLILDGTSNVTPSLYGKYKFKNVPNRHQYHDRIMLHWRKINTSANTRGKQDKGVQKAIARDITQIRNTGQKVFPLVGKDDISTYKENEVILPEQYPMYDKKNEDEDKLAMNIFNTTGKNDLRDVEELALTQMPIRNALFYKLKAIGLYGNKVDIRMRDSRDGGGSWFINTDVQTLYEQLVMADVLQIIHRTNLREINSWLRIHIYLYQNREEWIEQMQEQLGLTKDNITEFEVINGNLYDFENKCRAFAKQCREYCLAREPKDVFNQQWYNLSKVPRLKQFFKDHWGTKHGIIEPIFAEYSVVIRLQTKSNDAVWKYFGLDYSLVKVEEGIC